MQILRYILFPFSLLYWLITTIRNYLYNVGLFKSTSFSTPIIVVGNLSVGGTGKTPMVEYLVRFLKEDYKLAILSRGYKRKTKGFVLANKKTNVNEIGDEPFQYFNKFNNVTVAVDANRVRGINKLLALESKPDIILLDDAFQHRKVKSTCNILLTTHNNLYINDFILPVGNLRESRSGAKRANIVVVTKCPDTVSEEERSSIAKKLELQSNQQLFFSSISYDEELKGSSIIPLIEIKNKEVLLITGIANPKPLVKYLEAQSVSFKHLKFPDHHNFSSVDIDEIEAEFEKLKTANKILLTTEKDYMRLVDKIKNIHYIAIKNRIINSSEFENTIKNYVE